MGANRLVVRHVKCVVKNLYVQFAVLKKCVNLRIVRRVRQFVDLLFAVLRALLRSQIVHRFVKRLSVHGSVKHQLFAPNLSVNSLVRSLNVTTSPSGCPSRMSTKLEALEQCQWVVLRPEGSSPAWSSPSPLSSSPLRLSPSRCSTSLCPRPFPATTSASTSRTCP